jgi:predicted DNA-binding WGR domain protein
LQNPFLKTAFILLIGREFARQGSLTSSDKIAYVNFGFQIAHLSNSIIFYIGIVVFERDFGHTYSGSSKKFWEISISGNSFTVRFGRIGTVGQFQTKTFADEAKADSEAKSLIAEKEKKGYIEKK